jgi:hypothetical protein
MKIFCFIVLASVGTGPPIIEAPINTREDLVARIDKEYIGDGAPFHGIAKVPKGVFTDWVTPDFKPIIIEYLKAKAQKPEYFEKTQRALIALDDEATLIAAIDGFAKGTYAPDIEHSYSILGQNISPRGIKYLVPMIYEGYGKPRNFELHDIWSPQREAIKYFLYKLTLYRSFPSKTASWGAGFGSFTQDTGDDPHILWLFQQWWEHNKEAVLAERFSEATWIPMYKGQPDMFDEKVRDEPEYRIYSAATRNDIVKIPKRADISSIRPRAPKDRVDPLQQADSEPKPQGFAVMIGMAIAILIVALLVLITRRPASHV